MLFCLCCSSIIETWLTGGMPTTTDWTQDRSERRRSGENGGSVGKKTEGQWRKGLPIRHAEISRHQGGKGVNNRQRESKTGVETGRHASTEWVHLPAAGRCRGTREWGQEACWGSLGWGRPDQAALDPLHRPTAAQKQREWNSSKHILLTLSYGMFYHLFLTPQYALFSTLHCFTSILINAFKFPVCVLCFFPLVFLCLG